MNYSKNFTAVFPGVFSLSGSTQQVYLYLCFRYCLQTNEFFKLSYAQMQDGDDDFIGTGLNKSTIGTALSILSDEGLVKIKARKFKGKGGFQITIPYFKPYIVDTEGKATGEFDVCASSLNPIELKKTADTPLEKTDAENLRDQSSLNPIGSEKTVDSDRTENPIGSSFSSFLKKKDKKSKEIKNYDLPLLGSKKRKEDKYELASIMLRDALVAQDLLRRKCSIVKWAGDLRRGFTNKLNIPWDKMFAILEWYCDNVGVIDDPYMPDIRSTKTFVDKLEKVEAAILRQRNKPKADFHSTDDIPPPEDDTPPQDDQLRRDAMSHLL